MTSRPPIRCRLVAALCLSLLGSAPAETPSEPASRPVLDCSHDAPITQPFGDTPWLLFGCSDHESLVVVAPRHSPAGEYYFMLFRKGGHYDIVGRGDGDRSITDRARVELTQLSDAQVRALVKQAREAHPLDEPRS